MYHDSSSPMHILVATPTTALMIYIIRTELIVYTVAEADFEKDHEGVIVHADFNEDTRDIRIS